MVVEAGEGMQFQDKCAKLWLYLTMMHIFNSLTTRQLKRIQNWDKITGPEGIFIYIFTQCDICSWESEKIHQ